MELYKIENELMKELFSDTTIFDEHNVVDFELLDRRKVDFKEKVLDLAALYKNMKADAVAMKEYETQMRDKRKSLEKRAESLKGYIFGSMKRVEINKITGIESSISFRKIPGKVSIDNAAVISSEYYIEQDPVLNKAKIKEDLKDGLVVYGAHLELGECLSIR